MTLARVLLADGGIASPGPARIEYGTATGVNEVDGVAMEALQPVVAGDWVAYAAAGADRLILGAVGGEAKKVARYGALSWSTTSETFEKMPDIAVAVTPTAVGVRYLVTANLYVGANTNADDTFYTVITDPGSGTADTSTGATSNSMGYHRFQDNSGALEVANVVVAGVYTSTGTTEITFTPAARVRTTSPTQQISLNRRGSDTAIGAVSSLTVERITS